MVTYTFKDIGGGGVKFKKDVSGVSGGFHSPRFMPIMSANNSVVSFDSGTYSYNIDVTADTVIIDKTASTGISLTYSPGDITSDSLHDELNELFAAQNQLFTVYLALLNQSGTSAPTATVLENTIGETLTFDYDDVGRFIITSPSNKFISNKTFMVNGNPIMMESVTGEISLSVANTSAIIIRTTEIGAGAAKNGVLINSPIEIRVYN